MIVRSMPGQATPHRPSRQARDDPAVAWRGLPRTATLRDTHPPHRATVTGDGCRAVRQPSRLHGPDGPVSESRTPHPLERIRDRLS